MDLSNFSSYFEILSVSGFAYTATDTVRKIFNNSFSKLIIPEIFLKNKFKENIYEVEEKVLYQNKQNEDEIETIKHYNKKLEEQRIEFERVEKVAKERFQKKLPELYLTAAVFSMSMIFLIGCEKDLININRNNYIFSFFFFLFCSYITFIYESTPKSIFS